MSLKMWSSGNEIENVEIKGCPFCGNKELLISEKSSYEELCEKNGSSLIEIECKACNAINRTFGIPNNNYWIGVGMAIAKWNSRGEMNENSDRT